MTRYLFAILMAFSLPMFISAQGGNEEIDVVYDNQNFGGLAIHSRGWALSYSWGKYNGYKNLRTFGVDVGNLRHEKETRSFSPIASFPNGGSYYYGKLNSVFLIKPHIGKRHFITDKQRANGVEVGYSWEIGPTLALLKPVYLEIGYPNDLITFSQIERYDPQRHDISNILDRASYFRGISEIVPRLGGHAKFSFLFEYSDSKSRVKGIETGFFVDIFPTRLPIIADNIDGRELDVNRAIFPTFFVNFFVGKKFYQ